MFSKFELAIGGFCVGMMALALFLVQAESNLDKLSETQTAQVADAGIVFVSDDEDETAARTEALTSAFNGQGKLMNMVVDDITVGEGAAVEVGDTVLVHYVGTLQNGQEFDNSRRRGDAFEFTVGAGQVIKGWDEGLVGMQVGGQRILVIPPEKAYGDRGVGPIPGGATLVFAIDLLEIK